jgi:hypothetical protein
MRYVVLFVSLLCASLCPAARAASALVHVHVEKASSVLIDQDVAVELEHEASVTHAVPFQIKGAACNVIGKARMERDGEGRSGVTVSVIPTMAPDNSHSMRVVVHFAVAELVQPVAIAAGTTPSDAACHGETPAMLKYDSSAAFGLSRLERGSLRVGDYTVTVWPVRAERAPVNTI